MKKANEALCRTYLSELESAEIKSEDISGRDMWWFQVRGITNFGQKMSDAQYLKIFQEILCGCAVPFTTIGFLVVGNSSQGISFYLGITDDEESYESVKGIYLSKLYGVEIVEQTDYATLKVGKKYGGMVVGLPCQVNEQGPEKSSERFPIDEMCNGLLGKDFSFMVVAERQPEMLGNTAIQKVEDLIMQTSSLLTTNRANETGLQVTYSNILALNYQENLKAEQSVLHNGIVSGLWNVCVYYAATNESDALLLKNSIVSNYARERKNRYEQLRCIDIENGVGFLNSRPCMITTVDERMNENPINRIWERKFGENFYQHKFMTVMSSCNLAEYFALPKKEMIGFYVDEYVEFDCMVRERPGAPKLTVGNIITSGRKTAGRVYNPYEMSIEDISRHVLVIGATGGGKTNTMKSLLSEIWRKNGIPFLVIESAKREYIELLQTEKGDGCINEFGKMAVFTLGNESDSGVRYRINPFEVMPGITIQTHIDYLLSTFNAAFEMYAPMPYILERAVYEVYEDKGWDLFSEKNKRGLKEYPTLSQLYYKIDVVTDRLGYDGEIQSNVKAALKARINSLRIGGKGALLDTPRSIPLRDILSGPSVFELEDIGDDDTKAFIIGILLVQLYEYRKACGASKQMQGILVIEEAHRLLKSVAPSEGNNSRAKAVDFFCNMLAEIRSYGQGIFIADQIPTKLAQDTVKNTNLKIIHRTVMEDDRRCVGAAMNMTEEQINYLSSLRRGCAAVFSEGDSRPKLVKMPLIIQHSQRSRMELISYIKHHVEGFYLDYYAETVNRNMACLYCEKRNCPSREWLYKVENFAVERYRETILNNFTLGIIKEIASDFENKYKITNASNEMRFCTMGYILRMLKISNEKQCEILVQYMMNLFPYERR